MELLIEAEWEQLETGPPEERACFAALGIKVGDVWLTEADDAFVKRIREKVHLSGYKLAESRLELVAASLGASRTSGGLGVRASDGHHWWRVRLAKYNRHF